MHGGGGGGGIGLLEIVVQSGIELKITVYKLQSLCI